MLLQSHALIVTCAAGIAVGLIVATATGADNDGTCLVQPEQQFFVVSGEGSGWGTSVTLGNEVAAVGSSHNRVRIIKPDLVGNWVVTEELAPPDATDGFGTALAMRDGVLVVGAPLDDTHGIDTGAAYIFRFNGTHWVL